jgi:hypothetical protein
VHVAAPQDTARDIVFPKKKTAALLRRGLARVRDDLFAELW